MAMRKTKLPTQKRRDTEVKETQKSILADFLRASVLRLADLIQRDCIVTTCFLDVDFALRH